MVTVVEWTARLSLPTGSSGRRVHVVVLRSNDDSEIDLAGLSCAN